uniref:Uncharacterized protein n=1 Tax=uncultured marine virus TaxID=186617 RepID=A0A0F7L2W9_9VIRU|nr:hypothetical protein [uncultured marine virus]
MTIQPVCAGWSRLASGEQANMPSVDSLMALATRLSPRAKTLASPSRDQTKSACLTST